ncbi:MAG: hypothetical protein AMK69_13930 [Nitrospira bacterium SG8_3]|nr:MAG: hypothetical protein AMK69_13930 [Nitrospira bacterium SG8_3]
MNVKIMIERKFKKAPTDEDLRAIDELRIKALRQKGYIGGETIVNCDDPKEVLVISAWSSLEDWETWLKDRERDVLEDELGSRLEEPAKIRAFVPSADYVKETFG